MFYLLERWGLGFQNFRRNGRSIANSWETLVRFVVQFVDSSGVVKLDLKEAEKANRWRSSRFNSTKNLRMWPLIDTDIFCHGFEDGTVSWDLIEKDFLRLNLTTRFTKDCNFLGEMFFRFLQNVSFSLRQLELGVPPKNDDFIFEVIYKYKWETQTPTPKLAVGSLIFFGWHDQGPFPNLMWNPSWCGHGGKGGLRGELSENSPAVHGDPCRWDIVNHPDECGKPYTFRSKTSFDGDKKLQNNTTALRTMSTWVFEWEHVGTTISIIWMFYI